jgi:hypothetical protein
VEGLLRNAERILETAVAAKDEGAQDCTICITHLGAIRILAEPAGWSLPALAADLGAVALFRVERRGGNCVLRRDLCAPWWSHATRHAPEYCAVSKNDLSPQVRNS